LRTTRKNVGGAEILLFGRSKRKYRNALGEMVVKFFIWIQGLPSAASSRKDMRTHCSG